MRCGGGNISSAALQWVEERKIKFGFERDGSINVDVLIEHRGCWE